MTPELRFAAWEGPLDRLLELARAQRVDLAQVSVTALAEQFAGGLEAALARRAIPLTRLADWLVMAAWLLALRSRLLLPETAPENVEARAEATALRRQLAARAAAQRLATWLEQRPQLGREVFTRGAELQPAGPEPFADTTALLRACLATLQRPGRSVPYRPAPPPLWRVPEAIAHLRGMLAALPPEGTPLAGLLPRDAMSPLQRRAALASTLMAGLELARAGEAGLDQAAPFAEVRVAQAFRSGSVAPDSCA